MILTSNRTREFHDALKRRCLHHWVGYPTAEREVEIVMVRAPDATETLARKVVEAVNRLRGLDLAKPPGVAETLDWVATLNVLGRSAARRRAPSTTPSARSSRSETTWRRCSTISKKSRSMVDEGDAFELTDLAERSPFVTMLVRLRGELRDAGLPIGSGDLLGFSCAVASLNPGDLLDIYWAGRTTMITRRDHIPTYDRVFRSYFLDYAENLPDQVKLVLEQSSIENQSVIEIPATEPGQLGKDEEEARLGLMASDIELWRNKSFAACTPEELVALRKIMARIRADPSPPSDPSHPADLRPGPS